MNLPGYRADARILCYVTDRAGLPRQRPAGDSPQPADSGLPPQFVTLLDRITAVAAAGVDWIQIREKDLSAGALSWLTRAAIQACAATASKIIVNDRLDVALAERAAGVHLGENSLPLLEARRVQSFAKNCTGRLLAGVSCHSLESAQRAAAEGADYVIFGPVFPTPSKVVYGPAQGLARLAEICRALNIQVLAVGGITPENCGECYRAGAAGIAAIRLFQESADLPGSLRSLRSLP